MGFGKRGAGRIIIAAMCAGAVLANAAPAWKWAGGKQPGKITTPKTGKVNIGEFINLGPKEEWAHVIYNVANKAPGARPWVNWGVGSWPEHNAPLSDEKHEEHLAYFDALGVDVFLEVRPGSASVTGLIDTYLKKFGKHPSIKGFGVDLEFYQWKGNKNDDAKAMDDKLKSYNPAYRLFFKHWEAGNMPTYRGKNDMIFFSTSSESSPATLIQGHANFCNSFTATGTPTVACGFQIGYPADEPLGDNHVHNGPYDGWSKWQDPIKEWSDALLKAVTSPTAELGFVWVTVKSERIVWDLSKGANIPTAVRPERAAGRFLTAERDGARLRLSLGGAPMDIPAGANLLGRKITPAEAYRPAAGATVLRP